MADYCYLNRSLVYLTTPCLNKKTSKIIFVITSSNFHQLR